MERFRKYFLTGETVYDVNYPFYLFTKGGGLLPVTIVGDRTDGIIRTTFVDWVFFAYIMGFFCYTFFINIVHDKSSTYYDSNLLNSGSKLAVLIATLNSIIGPMVNVKNRHKIWDCLNKFHQFDLKVLNIICGMKIIVWTFLDCKTGHQCEQTFHYHLDSGVVSGLYYQLLLFNLFQRFYFIHFVSRLLGTILQVCHLRI